MGRKYLRCTIYRIMVYLWFKNGSQLRMNNLVVSGRALIYAMTMAVSK